jgi:hypothetical protein
MVMNFYFDESGYKGNLSEIPNDSDFCLVAGFAMDSDHVQDFSEQLKKILNDVKLNPGEKFHATEIFKDKRNEDIKTKLLTLIIEEPRLFIFHSAISCLGFFKSKEKFKKLLGSFKSTTDSGIKPSGVHNKDNIYFETFTDIMIKIDEFCNENNVTKLNLITDRIDEGIEKECQKIINEINLNLTERKHTGFDTISKTVIQGSVKMEIKGFNMGVKHIKDLQVDIQNSELTIAADIITNLIYRHIKNKLEAGFNEGLNGTELFNDFILKNKIIYLDNENFYDKIYKK